MLVRRFLILQIIFFSLFFSSCQNSYSTTDLANDVKMSIIEEWNKLGITGISVTNFSLIHQEGNKYKGLLSTYETDEYGNNDEFRYSVDVTYDGEYFMWEILSY